MDTIHDQFERAYANVAALLTEHRDDGDPYGLHGTLTSLGLEAERAAVIADEFAAGLPGEVAFLVGVLVGDEIRKWGED